MKKFLSTLLGVTLCICLQAQNSALEAGGVLSPFIRNAKDLSYSNYKSYNAYLVLTGASANSDVSQGLDGEYTLAIPGLEKKGADADFKIVFGVSSMKSTMQVSRDTGYLGMNYIMNVNVLDKKGAVVFEKEENATAYSFIKGITNNDQIKARAQELKRIALGKAMNKMLGEFEMKYLNGITMIKAWYMTFGFGFKSNESMTKTFDAIAALKKEGANQKPDDYLLAVKKYMPLWEELTTVKDVKKAENINFVGFHNLAISYLLLNDTVNANIHFAKADSADGYVKYITRLVDEQRKDLIALQEKPMVTEAVHPESLTSNVKNEDAVDRAVFFIINGTATTVDGATQKGTFKLKKPVVVESSGGGIADLDNLFGKEKAPKDAFVYKDEAGTATEGKLSAYSKFVSDNGTVYYVENKGKDRCEVYQTLAQNNKAAAVKTCYPTPSSAVCFKKSDDPKVFSPKVFREAKSTAEYFSDCAELSEKIKNKDVKVEDYNTIITMYGACK